MFKTLTACLDKNARPLEKDLLKIPDFLFAKYLSNDIRTIQAAAQFNLYNSIPIQCQWKAIQDSFGGKIRYIAYPKNPPKDNTEALKCIQKRFGINSELAKEYMEMLPESEIKEITEKYKDYL